MCVCVCVCSGCVVLDKDEFCLGLTVYNLASSVQFSAGKVLTIPDPLLKSCCVRYKVIHGGGGGGFVLNCVVVFL